MDRKIPLYDTTLPVEERAKWLVSQMTIEDKFEGFARGLQVSKYGISARTICGEGAHGVQARSGQREAYGPTPTTSFT